MLSTDVDAIERKQKAIEHKELDKKRDLYDNFVSFSETFQFHSPSEKVYN